MVWNKHHPQRRYYQFFNDILSNYRWRPISIRNRGARCRRDRDNRHHRNHRTNCYHYLVVCLLSVGPAYAEPEVHNTASPVAAATGNVTNQAIQFQNTGAPSRQAFKNGVSCNGATMTASPFYTGGDVHTDEYHRTGSFGLSLNFSMPLDGGMIEQCKGIARRQEQKMRLDYELVRAIKCGELMQKGFMFKPGSRFYPLCSDIIAISAYEKESNRESVQRAPQPRNNGILITY